MKKISFFLILICIILSAVGCGKKQMTEVQLTPETTEREEVATEDSGVYNVIKSSKIPDDILEWNEVSAYEGNLDDDEDYEVVKLVTSAEYDIKNGFLWNDGQSWALMVDDDDTSYLLYNDYISSGSPYFEVSEYYTDNGSKMQIDFILSSGAKLMLVEYAYDKTQKGYIEKVLYDSGTISDGGLNKVHSSLPLYE